MNYLIGFLLKAGMAVQERWKTASWSTRIHFVDRTTVYRIPVYPQMETFSYECPCEGPTVDTETITMYKFADSDQAIYVGYGPRSDVLCVHYVGHTPPTPQPSDG